MENEHTQPSPRTREAERADAQVHATPDALPSPDEEQAAKRAAALDASVEESYKAAAERGANQTGEGRIP